MAVSLQFFPAVGWLNTQASAAALQMPVPRSLSELGSRPKMYKQEKWKHTLSDAGQKTVLFGISER